MQQGETSEMAKWQPQEALVSQAFNRMLASKTKQVLGLEPAPPPPTEATKRKWRIAHLKMRIHETIEEIELHEFCLRDYKKELAELEGEVEA